MNERKVQHKVHYYEKRPDGFEVSSVTVYDHDDQHRAVYGWIRHMRAKTILPWEWVNPWPRRRTPMGLMEKIQTKLMRLVKLIRIPRRTSQDYRGD